MHSLAYSRLNTIRKLVTMLHFCVATQGFSTSRWCHLGLSVVDYPVHFGGGWQNSLTPTCRMHEACPPLWWLKCPSWVQEENDSTETSALVAAWCTVVSSVLEPGRLEGKEGWCWWMMNYRTTCWRSRLDLATWWIENPNFPGLSGAPRWWWSPSMLRSTKPCAFLQLEVWGYMWTATLCPKQQDPCDHVFC